MKHLGSRAWLGIVVAATLLALGAAVACRHIPGEQERAAMALASNYLVKDSSLQAQYRITSEGLSLFDTAFSKPDRAPEVVLYWEEVPLFRRMVASLPNDSLLHIYEAKGDRHWEEKDFPGLTPTVAPFKYDPKAVKPLQGLRVALDPGHVGGSMDYAQFMEEKYVRIHPDTSHGFDEEVAFCEGNLALGTALLLAERLRAAGAEVLLTREREGLNAFGITWEQWLDRSVQRHEARLRRQGVLVNTPSIEQWRIRCAAENYIEDFHITGKDADWWRSKATLAHVHRIAFLKSEFVERARIINSFRPHLTLILHYNVGEGNNAASDGYRRGIPENYCMAFIPGSFMGGELKEPGDRLAFACKLLGEDIARSEALSASVVRAHERLLGVTAMEWDDRLLYLKNASLRTPSKGVFARNLQLTRLIHGTLCFGESLYQDNYAEAKALNAKDFTLPGMVTPLPNRIRTVADAYYEGMLEWLAAN